MKRTVRVGSNVYVPNPQRFIIDKQDEWVRDNYPQDMWA